VEIIDGGQKYKLGLIITKRKAWLREIRDLPVRWDLQLLLLVVAVRHVLVVHHAVAAQLEYEKTSFETTISHFRLQGLKPGGFQAMG
jgi:hypothetical protein